MTTTGTGLCLPGSERYARGREGIAGWFDWLDTRLFDTMLGCQLGTDVRGDLLEIGCYRGKSAILMAYGLREGEKLVVCDPFEGVLTHPHFPRSADLDTEGAYGARSSHFYQNWDQYHYWRPDVRECESSELDLGDQQFRFIHIDGCHTYTCVVKDIELAAVHTSPLGVIALDDYRSAHLPGVAAAIWEAAAKGVIHPFCVSGQKLYATANRLDQDYWVQLMRTMAVPMPWQWDVCSLPKYEIVRTFDNEHSQR